MKILLFGATGMVGQGVLTECLKAKDVTHIVAVGRTAPPQQDPRLHTLQVPDMALADLSSLSDFDACFYCLGASSSGKTEAEYTALMHDLPLSVARKLKDANPHLTFVFITGAGAYLNSDTMWKRVLGMAEHDIQALGLHRFFAFRPGIIQPLGGIRPKQGNYQLFYTLMKPFFPLVRTLFPNHILTTALVGQAMLNATRQGFPRPVLEIRDIRTLADHRP